MAGNLTSAERRLPHPDGGQERVLRVWGTPDRSAQRVPLCASPRDWVALTQHCARHAGGLTWMIGSVVNMQKVISLSKD